MALSLKHKTLDFDIRQVGDPEERTLEFIGSTADVDRYGDIIEVAGWDLKNYKKNPVFLWAHDYRQPPVGKAVSVKKTDDALIFQIKFPTVEEYAFADTVYKLYLGGYLQATSVGFRDLESEPIKDKDERTVGYRYLKQELYELSAVPVPANPSAVMLAVQKGIITGKEAEAFNASAPEWEERKVIPFKEYPADPEDAPWDGPAEIKAAEVKALKVMCAWFDAENPDVKGSYKLPHHRADGFNTVWRGVSAAMAALLGARGGVNIPDGDRKGVYNHLAKHYAQFDKTPPEFKEAGGYTEAELACIEAGLPPLTIGRILGRLSDLEARLAALEAREAPAWLKTFMETQNKLQEVLLGALGPKLAPATDLYRQLLDPGAEPEGGQSEDNGTEAMKTLINFTKGIHALITPKGI